MRELVDWLAVGVGCVEGHRNAPLGSVLGALRLRSTHPTGGFFPLDTYPRIYYRMQLQGRTRKPIRINHLQRWQLGRHPE